MFLAWKAAPCCEMTSVRHLSEIGSSAEYIHTIFTTILVAEQLVTNKTGTAIWHGYQPKTTVRSVHQAYKLKNNLQNKEIKNIYNLFSRKWEEIHLTNYSVHY